MATASRHLGALLALLLLLASGAWGQGVRSGPTADGSTTSEGLTPERRAELQRRWASLSDEQRAELRRRYERLRALGPEERAELRRRAEGLARVEARLERTLDPELRERLQGLDPERRRALMQELVREEVTARGRHLLDQLPEDLRDDLRGTDRRGRRHAFEALRERQSRALPEAVQQLGRSLELTPAELERLRGLESELARQRLAALVRRRVTLHVQRSGLPEGLPPQVWQRFETLDDEEFLGAVLRFRERHPEWSPIPRGHRPGAPLENPDGGRRAATDGHRTPAPDTRKSLLRRALWIAPEVRLELAELPPRERRERLEARRRQQVLEALEQGAWVDPARLDALGALPTDQLLDVARDLLEAGASRR